MRTKKLIIIFFSLLTFLYAATLRGHVGSYEIRTDYSTVPLLKSVFESPHERSTYALIVSIVRDQSISLTNSLVWFGTMDMGTYNGKIYSFFPPGVALISLPLFAIGLLGGLAQMGVYATVSLCALLNAALIARISRKILKLSVPASLFAALTFACASPAWSYGVSLYQHQATTLMMLSSLYASFLYRNTKKNWWLYVSLSLYAASWIFDYTNLIILFPIVIYNLKTAWEIGGRAFRSAALPTVLCGAAALLSIFTYNTAVFGSWHVFSNNLARIPVTPHLPIITTVRESLFVQFNLLNIPKGLYILLVAPYKGLFFFSPLYLAAVYMVVKWWKKAPRAAGLLAGLALSTLLLYSLFKYPAGGYAFGPRYLIPLMAVLSPLIGLFVEKCRFKYSSIVIGALSTMSAALCLLAALTTNMIPFITSARPGEDYTLGRPLTLLFENSSPSFSYHYFFSRIPLSLYYTLILGIVSLMIIYLLREIKKIKA